MKNKEVVKELSNRLGWTSVEVTNILTEFSSIIGSKLVEGDIINLEEFGQFESRKKGERISVNPANGKRYLIPPKLVPVFKPGITLKNQLKEIESNE